MSRETEINASTACLWPIAAWMPTSQVLEGMRKLTGYRDLGLELLPSRAVVFELNSKGLSVPNANITSTHDTWQIDREKDERLGNPNSRQDAILCSNLFFPPIDVARETLDRLNDAQNPIPTVFHWKEDSIIFPRPALEVHSMTGRGKPSDATWSPRRIIEWAEKGSKRGLVIDLSKRKIGEYCKAIGVDTPEGQMQVVQNLMPHVSEAHFQISNTDEMGTVVNGDTDSFMGEVTRMAKQNQLPIVLEINLAQMLLMKVNPATIYRRAVDFIHKA